MVYRPLLGALLSVAALTAPAHAAGPQRRRAPPPTLLIAGPDILGTQAVMIKADRFSDSLKRAREDASKSPVLQRLIAPARQLSPIQQMAFVQAAVTNSIHWISDATEWGQHDYWASA
ncbi:MAG TPA: hypothetical protein VGM04_06600, partial [Sphingomicrobium sp.]